MNYQPDVFDLYSSAFEGRRQTELSLREYLTLCRDEPTTFATAAERMTSAATIGCAARSRASTIPGIAIPTCR